MNEKFLELPEEKRLKIINAGFEVFSHNEYKRASTDTIAQLAGISKGLLFYYFHNKKAFYLFLFDYAAKLITDSVVNGRYNEITDFFELCEYASERKLELLREMPSIMDFVMRAFFSQREEISDELGEWFQKTSSVIFEQYFTNIDFTKFKDDVNPAEILQMLTWMAEGYFHSKQRTATEIEQFAVKYRKWTQLFKQIAYKEEALK